MDDSSPVCYSKRVSRDPKRFITESTTYVKEQLGNFVIAARLLIWFLQFMFNRFNFSTDAFKGLPLPFDEQTSLDRAIRFFFRGFTQWDAAHMLHIAEHGYVLENSLAFYPLFPLTVRYLSFWASPLIYFKFVHVSSVHLLTSVILNLIIFRQCAMLLFDCVERITQSVKHAHIAVILFAINPASIFFSSAYSEPMFILWTLSGISYLLTESDNSWKSYFTSLFFFALACLTRSNGLLNLGYVGFYCALNTIFVNIDENDNTRKKTLLIYKDINTIASKIMQFLIKITVAVVAMTFLVTLFGVYQQHRFCTKSTLSSIPQPLIILAESSNTALAGQVNKITWCSESNLVVPSFYSSIQEKYWNVSLFGYWKMQKLPCFLLSAPAFALVVFGAIITVADINKLGILQYLVNGGELLPYFLHSVCLGLGALFVYNSEVLTRVLFSSSPFAYLVLARWMSDATPQAIQSDLLEPAHMPFFSYFALRGQNEFIVFIYFIGYFILGSACHIMGLPFT